MSGNNRSHHSQSLLEETRSPLARFCQRAIFALVLLILVTAPLFAARSRPWVEVSLMAAIALAGGFWILHVLLVHEAQAVFSQLGPPVLTVGSFALVRYSLAEFEPLARPDVLLVLSSTMLFFLTLNTVRHRWQITILVWTVTGMGVFLTLLAIAQVLRGEPPTATFARPADLGIYLLLALPVVVANFFFSRRSLSQKVVFAFSGLLMMAGFVLLRAYWHWLGWLAAFLVVGWHVVHKRGWRFRWLLVGGAVLAAVLLLMAPAGYRLRPPGQSLPAIFEKSAPPRPVRGAPSTPEPLWKSVLAIGQRNLWFGAGPGMVEWLYPTQRNLQARVRRAGSEYCNLFAEGGMVGCLLVAWVLIAFVVAVAQILRLRAGRYSAAQQSNRFAFAIAGMAIIAGVIVNAAVDLNLRVAANSYTLVAIMGAVLTCGVHRRAHEEEPAEQPGRYSTLRLRGTSRYVFAAGLTVWLTLLVLPLRRSFPAAWLQRQAQQAVQQLDWAGAERAYLQAWKFDSRSFETAMALGDLFTSRATWNAAQREALGNQALTWYRRARTLNPYAYDVLIRIGRVNDMLGLRSEALDFYKQAVQSDSRNASYHAQLGWHHERWEETELAESSFRTARQLGASEVLPPAGS